MDGDASSGPLPRGYEVGLLADRPELVETVTDLRWREWGHDPEPTSRDWWHAATVREAGRDTEPLTWVAYDASGALGAVGLGRFDIDERRDRSPWLLGMIVRPDRRGDGVGRRLLNAAVDWAGRRGHAEVWVANEGPAVDFYIRCGWQVFEVIDRADRRRVTVLRRHVGDGR